MTFKLIGSGEETVAVAQGDGVLVATPQDMLDMIATLAYQHGCRRLALHKSALDEAFFELKTGLAGEMLQKVVNYHAALAIVGDFSAYTSKALRDFIRESNEGSRIFFVATEEEAALRLQRDAVL